MASVIGAVLLANQVAARVLNLTVTGGLIAASRDGVRRLLEECELGGGPNTMSVPLTVRFDPLPWQLAPSSGLDREAIAPSGVAAVGRDG